MQTLFPIQAAQPSNAKDSNRCIEMIDLLYLSCGQLARLKEEIYNLEELQCPHSFAFESMGMQEEAKSFKDLKEVIEKLPEEMRRKMLEFDDSVVMFSNWEETFDEEAKKNVVAPKELIPLLDWLFHQYFLKFQEFYHLMLNSFIQGYFQLNEKSDSLYQTARYHHFLGLVNLIERIQQGALKADMNERNLYLIGLFTIMEEIEKNPDLESHYSLDLLSIFRVDNSTVEGRILVDARNLLFAMLKNGSNESCRALKFYETLSLPEEDQAQRLNTDSFETEIGLELLLNELEDLFPKYVASFPFIHAWGLTTLSGEMLVRDTLLMNYQNNIKIVQLMLLFLHELANSGKLLILTRQDPENFESIWIEKENPFKTPGKLLEKYCFGHEISLQMVTEAIARKVMLNKDWGVLKERCEGSPSMNIQKRKKCGNGAIMKQLAKQKEKNEFVEAWLKRRKMQQSHKPQDSS